MFIILFAHIPWNAWANWIPARFGFSDATEIFVFCSGVASALAFGRVFERRGWALGAARIVQRIWQVYWAHIGVFVATVAVLGAAQAAFPGGRYLADLNLAPFLADPAGGLLGLLTLTYVPNYFDILPMYLVILGLIPVAMAAAGRGLGLAATGSVALWCLAAVGTLELPAEPWSDRAWFFNPFSWQLLFFAGFAFGRGWLRPPAFNGKLALAAAAVLIAAAPVSCQFGFECHAAWGTAPWLGDAHRALFPLIDKTHLGPLRIMHFAALAYLAYSLAGEGGRRLVGPLCAGVALVGRQTLAVFMTGLVLAQALGVALDRLGHGWAAQTGVNVVGCATLVVVAGLVEWFKGAPWSGKGRAAPAAGSLLTPAPVRALEASRGSRPAPGAS
jgi:hypothetical protein